MANNVLHVDAQDFPTAVRVKVPSGLMRFYEPVETCEDMDTSDYEFFRCSKCGFSGFVEFESSGYGRPNYCPNCGRTVER